jgi:hypothetical protein
MFMLGPKAWVWVITKKRSSISIFFTQEVKENYQKMILKICASTQKDPLIISN